MLLAFENYVKKNGLFSKEDKLLLAFSGGEDSVCLFHLLVRNNYRFSVAHCNFQLRGADSRKDELFAKSLAKSHRVPFFSIQFDTKKEAKKLKMGIQETARKLRYDWFHEILETYNFDKLLTAHHQGDNSETLLINMLRSTGISGLHGIPVIQQKIRRPLMFTNREKISRFIDKHKLKFRLDKSNLSDHYLRNAIRQHVMPELRKLEPELDQVLFSVSSQVLEFEQLATGLIEKEWIKLLETAQGGFRLSMETLDAMQHPEAFLFYNLRNWGFNRSQVHTLSGMSLGKKIESPEWEILKERDAYFLRKKKEAEPVSYVIKPGSKSLKTDALELTFSKISGEKVNLRDAGYLFLDISGNPYPLTVRTWQKGDRMQPLGMKGSKKISDILTDKKMIHSSRQQQLVILDKQGRIMALLPGTVSETCKIDSTTVKVLSIHVKTL